MGGLRSRRALLLLLVPVLVLAVFAGLARLGWSVGALGRAAPEHGPLLVIGVFGTVIQLERAVALGKPWGYAGAWCGGLAAAALVTRSAVLVPPLVLGASAGAVVTNAAITKRGPASFTLLMLVASILYAAGNAAWLQGAPVPDVVPAWSGFFVLTIVAERLELSRLAGTPSWANRLLLVLAALLGLLVVLRLFWHAGGLAAHALGTTLAGLALWELRFDLARRTLRGRGLPRYTAAAVLAGAGWLFVSGAVSTFVDVPPAGPLYDAALHAVFVGFVLSMVFAHAPIIVPAVARARLPYHPLLYVPLVLLHVGLALRIAGDLALGEEVRRAGGLLSAVALFVFPLVAASSRLLGAR
jgi:hypothetical protein